MFDLLISTVTLGLFYSIMAYGLYITYKILDFPDLTVDGSFPLGAAISALLITNGVNTYFTLPIAMLVGAVAGLCTGLIHVKLKVRDLLAGIITMTGLYSINLVIAGSNLFIDKSYGTIFSQLPFSIPLQYKKLLVGLALAIAIKVGLDLYFKTKSGLLLRGVGDNHILVSSLAKDSGKVKIMGLVIANSLVALCGAVICQEQRSFSSTMGTGQMVTALTMVIIGATLFKRFGVVKGTTATLVGSVLYECCFQLAINFGLPPIYLKLATAALLLFILVLGRYRTRKGVAHA